ncbi:methyl-accepting chemotaxis protein [Paenibacillus gansuensis]|uniref:Methyl-accepting chemotaxis protein n=1 Tax=Paenibacillus gansuensis TaxID=306542 RepID=A0ABW5PH02_9BACL
MKWFTNRKLTFKLAFMIGLLLIVAFGSIIGFNLNLIYKNSVRIGESDAKNTTSHLSADVQANLTQVEEKLNTFRNVMKTARTTNALSREEIVRMLRSELSMNDQLIAVYTVWEPNAFDGKDASEVLKHPYDDATGRFVPYLSSAGGQIRAEPTLDYDKEGAGDFYLIPKKTKETVWIEPYIYPVSGVDTLMTSIVLPITDVNNKFVGIIGGDIALNTLQKNIEKLKPKGGYTTMISAGGLYVANGSSSKLISKPYTTTSAKKALWTEVKKGKVSGYANDIGGKDTLRVFVPIAIKGVDAPWYIESVIPKKNILDTYYQSLALSLTISIIALAILGAVIFWIIRYFVIRQVQEVIVISENMAKGDFTGKLIVKNEDEFGFMARHFNTMIDNLRNMIRTLTEHSMSLGATSEQLTASAEQTGKAAETISSSIQEVAASSEAQENDARETARSMNDMAIGISRIAESASLVSESASDVTAKTTAGNTNIQQAIEQMEVVNQNVQENTEIIQKLNEQSSVIGQITDVISNISAQTNLLALNAAIEAARAGEHGKGFAVVASEVRKLAEQSGDASAKIAKMIEEIQSETRKAAATMQQGAVEVSKGVDIVAVSGELFRAILDEMNHVNSQVQEVSAAAEQMSASSEQVLATVEQFTHIAQGTSENSQNVAAASEEQLATMEEITASTAHLNDMVQELLEMVSKFKV